MASASSKIVKDGDEDDFPIPDRLTCPVCFNPPEKEVFQCRDGHVLCSKCYFKMKECPQCRATFKKKRPIRNRYFESELEQFAKIECSFEGCKMKFRKCFMEQHQNGCYFNFQKFGTPDLTDLTDLIASDDFGRTVLHCAAQFSNKNALDFFIHCGLDVNETENNGKTPFHYAMMNYNGEKITGAKVKCLIVHGADPDVKDDDGRTPLDTLMTEGNGSAELMENIKQFIELCKNRLN